MSITKGAITMKNIIAGLCAVVLSFAAQAEDSIKVDLLVTKGDRLITKTSVVTTNGVAIPISQMTTTSYGAMATKAADGTVTITPGEISSGFMSTVVPVMQQDGRIRLQVSMSISELLGLEQLRTADGLEVDVPKQSPVSVLTQDVVVDQGKPIVLRLGGDTYRVEIIASAI